MVAARCAIRAVEDREPWVDGERDFADEQRGGVGGALEVRFGDVVEIDRRVVAVFVVGGRRHRPARGAVHRQLLQAHPDGAAGVAAAEILQGGQHAGADASQPPRLI